MNCVCVTWRWWDSPEPVQTPWGYGQYLCSFLGGWMREQPLHPCLEPCWLCWYHPKVQQMGFAFSGLGDSLSTVVCLQSVQVRCKICRLFSQTCLGVIGVAGLQDGLVRIMLLMVGSKQMKPLLMVWARWMSIVAQSFWHCLACRHRLSAGKSNLRGDIVGYQWGNRKLPQCSVIRHDALGHPHLILKIGALPLSRDKEGTGDQWERTTHYGWNTFSTLIPASRLPWEMLFLARMGTALCFQLFLSSELSCK